MLYQKLLMGETPYHFYCGRGDGICGFPEHRHPEAEFIYCKEGGFEIKINNRAYTVTEGDLVIIAPMDSHELIYSRERDTAVIEVGPYLLRKKFDLFSDGRITSSVKRLDGGSETVARLRDALEETVSLYNGKDEFSELLLMGNIYRICGYILSEFAESTYEMTKDMKAVANIDKALDMIQNRYSEPITVEMAAEATGYGKSNFCRLFRSITGDTFHGALNRQRVESACIYLDETDMPVSKISSEVGFSETKSFCRVFKSVMGITPGERRKMKKDS